MGIYAKVIIDLVCWLLISLLVTAVCATKHVDPNCSCDDDDIGYWTIDRILVWQKLSDFLIALAYFSIPIELLYFISCSNSPYKWILFEFISFIVLCGMTHLLSCLTHGPHSYQLSLILTVFKYLAAILSGFTVITLYDLIPMLLKFKVREFWLKKKNWDLDREVGIIKRQNEAGLYVRLLTQEIRKSLDRNTILYTTMVELSATLDLQNCAVWMPNENEKEMNLTYQLKGRAVQSFYSRPISCSDPDVTRVKETNEVVLLKPDSLIGVASSGGLGDPGSVVAIRISMLRVSNFEKGEPQLIKACYGIFVLVAPLREDGNWRDEELEMIQVVVDQVAVAISHAAVLEESQLIRDKLVEQNQAIQMAKKDAIMANQARNSFQIAMSNGMRKPMQTIFGLLSLLKDENVSSEQKLIIDTMIKTKSVLLVLVSDMTDDSPKEIRNFPFQLRELVKEAGCLAKCFCVNYGYGFTIEVDKSLPSHVVGDEKRVFQLILYMIGNLLDINKGAEGGSLRFRVFSQSGKELRGDLVWAMWTSTYSDDSDVYVRFEVDVAINGRPPADDSTSSSLYYSQRHYREAVEGDLSFRFCQKLVEAMQGNIWVFPNKEGNPLSMVLVLRFQHRPSIGINIPDPEESSSQQLLSDANTYFKGLQVILADADDMNRAVTQKLLEKLGCCVTAVSSGYDCLSASGSAGSHTVQVVFLDLHFHDVDGFEVATRIRRLCNQKWPLIVVLTASGDEESVWEKLKAVGINGVMRKPVMLEELVDELHRVVGQAKIGVA